MQRLYMLRRSGSKPGVPGSAACRLDYHPHRDQSLRTQQPESDLLRLWVSRVILEDGALEVLHRRAGRRIGELLDQRIAKDR